MQANKLRRGTFKIHEDYASLTQFVGGAMCFAETLSAKPSITYIKKNWA